MLGFSLVITKPGDKKWKDGTSNVFMAAMVEARRNGCSEISDSSLKSSAVESGWAILNRALKTFGSQNEFDIPISRAKHISHAKTGGG